METVSRRIEGLIRSGELRVGSRLPSEPKLAEMLGVSRSSLREALKGLMFLGLIKARPGYGTYIQSSLGRAVGKHFQWMLLLQEVKYLELYELRKILEPNVAALAARRATNDDLARMEAAIRGMKASFDRPEQYMAFEMSLHEELAQASKNVAVEAMLRMMYGALAEGRRRTSVSDRKLPKQFSPAPAYLPIGRPSRCQGCAQSGSRRSGICRGAVAPGPGNSR